jgi:hypothetical protein
MVTKKGRQQEKKVFYSLAYIFGTIYAILKILKA